LIERYLEYFRQHGHAVIPGASLVPENDPSVLFTTAGMHPLVPFLLGEPHPAGRRLANVQKCLRTDDIDNVGDGFHHTFFLMLGNWSLGDYFKAEAIATSFEFLASPEYLGIDPQRLYVTVFRGDEDAPPDGESVAIWQRTYATVGMEARLGERIYAFGKKENWWGPVGETGPCGPDTEMFYDTGKPACGPDCDPSCSCGKYVEIWNDVFLEYYRHADGTYTPLTQRNVDTGMGVARVTAVTSGYGDDDYCTELFAPLIAEIEALSGRTYDQDDDTTRSMRIVADHMRSSVFAVGDGVAPSNVERGYVVRRLIRRAIRHGRLLGISGVLVEHMAGAVIDAYRDLFPELEAGREVIVREMGAEEERFARTLDRGLNEFAKRVAGREGDAITGQEAFDLYQTYGFPLELTVELAAERGLAVDEAGFHAAYEEHQRISRAGATQRFAGGLGDHSEQATRLHTATHLLHAALRHVLGPHVEQKGSNITPERLRFDFAHPQAMTAEEVQQVEDLVNAVIGEDLPVGVETMTLDEALASGALAFFGEKYGDAVKVYSVAGFSREVCGGPHVASTGELGRLRIAKEQSSGRGVRRIRAVLVES
jgi:alanyl-tRNA synthetase